MKNILSKLRGLWVSESPKWGKVITNLGVLLSTISIAILGIEEVKKDWIPELYTQYAKHAFTISLVIAAIFKFTKKTEKTTKEEQ